MSGMVSGQQEQEGCVLGGVQAAGCESGKHTEQEMLQITPLR